MLQHLSLKLPESALHRREAVLTGLQAEVDRLQQQGLEKGSRMQEVLQVGESCDVNESSAENLSLNKLRKQL